MFLHRVLRTELMLKYSYYCVLFFKNRKHFILCSEYVTLLSIDEDYDFQQALEAFLELTDSFDRFDR